jgi:peptidylprolyl isomerase
MSTMKKSEKLKGKAKVAARRQQYKWVGVAAVAAVIVICAVLYIILSNPVVAAVGDTVNVTYTGMFENKTVFDTNVNGTPLSFTIGAGQMIKGFDTAVRGMKVNEEKIVTIPYDQAYGAYDPSLVELIPTSKFPANQTITPGEKFYFVSSVSGNEIPVIVINSTSAGVFVDANSPLAGQNLTFDIKIDSIQKGISGSTATGTS